MPHAQTAALVIPRSTHEDRNDTSGLPLLLTRLVGEASLAFDCDRDRARASLRRAAELLQLDARSHPPLPAAPVKGGLTPFQMNRVLAEIENRIATPIALQCLSAVAQLSTSYFSRAFKASMGRSPHSYITERRVAKAQHLMETTSEPLCHISIACGFSDQAHFSRIFKRAVGSSPNKWRRMIA